MTLVEIAHHEAAHAVVHVVLGYELECVSIKEDPATQSVSQTKGTILPPTVTEERIRNRDVFDEKEAEAIIDNVTNLLAGDVAEAHLNGRRYRLDVNQEQNHTRDERWLLGQLQSLYANGTDYSEADRNLEQLTVRAEQLVDEHWRFLSSVAEELVNRECLSGPEVVELRP